jgi:hypothetical protein
MGLPYMDDLSESLRLAAGESRIPDDEDLI